MEAKSFVAEQVKAKDLKPHPRNYQQHPDYQLRHIMKSIETHGFYRNVVIAKDNTILAGHGVVEASIRLGIEEIPVHKVDLDPNDTKALQILTQNSKNDKLQRTFKSYNHFYF